MLHFPLRLLNTHFGNIAEALHNTVSYFQELDHDPTVYIRETPPQDFSRMKGKRTIFKRIKDYSS